MTPKDPQTDPKEAMNLVKGHSGASPDADAKREVEDDPPLGESPPTTRSSERWVRLAAVDSVVKEEGEERWWCRPWMSRRRFQPAIPALVGAVGTLAVAQESVVVGILLVETLPVVVDANLDVDVDVDDDVDVWKNPSV